MVVLISVAQAQKKLAENMQAKRLALDLTQKSLSERSGVALSSLRKFEQTGEISLGSLLQLLMIVGDLEEFINATKPITTPFASIQDVINASKHTNRKRGRRQ